MRFGLRFFVVFNACVVKPDANNSARQIYAENAADVVAEVAQCLGYDLKAVFSLRVRP